jgi:hypothetical protein
MALTENGTVFQQTLAERIALVRVQLAPIASRAALLDSYRRESLCRLAATALLTGTAADVLEAAYAMRWAELEPEPEPEGTVPGALGLEPVDA